MNKKLRVGVIGVGHLGKFHAEKYHKNKDCFLHCVSDTSRNEATVLLQIIIVSIMRTINQWLEWLMQLCGCSHNLTF